MRLEVARPKIASDDGLQPRRSDASNGSTKPAFAALQEERPNDKWPCTSAHYIWEHRARDKSLSTAFSGTPERNLPMYFEVSGRPECLLGGMWFARIAFELNPIFRKSTD